MAAGRKTCARRYLGSRAVSRVAGQQGGGQEDERARARCGARREVSRGPTFQLLELGGTQAVAAFQLADNVSRRGRHRLKRRGHGTRHGRQALPRVAEILKLREYALALPVQLLPVRRDRRAVSRLLPAVCTLLGRGRASVGLAFPLELDAGRALPRRRTLARKDFPQHAAWAQSGVEK